jgi:hypothetical protein
MIVTCTKCEEEFLLKPDHKGFADICEACFLPHKLTGSELNAAEQAVDEKNRVIRKEDERKRRMHLAETRQRIQAGWSPENTQKELEAFRRWVWNRLPDDDESFVFFFSEMKISRRRKFYL